MVAVVEFLLELGADPMIRDRKGRTPADHARKLRLHDLVRLLEGAAGQGGREEAVRRWIGLDRLVAGWGVLDVWFWLTRLFCL